MADITRLLGELRGLEPPAEPYHPAIARRKARQAQASAQAGQEPAAAGEGQETALTGHPDDSPSPGATPP
jgi:hypothetical protein